MALQFMWSKDFLLQWTYSTKLCRFSLMFPTGFTSLSVLLLFPLLIAFFNFVHDFRVEEVLSLNASANVFVFVGIIKTGLSILVELIYLVNSVIIFLNWSISDGWLSYSDPRLWFWQSCSFLFTVMLRLNAQGVY